MDAVTVDLTEILLGISTILIAILMRRLPEMLGMQIEERHRNALRGALDLGVEYALRRFDANGDGEITVETRSRVLADAIGYAKRHTPDAVEYFRKDKQALEEMATARLSLAAQYDDTAQRAIGIEKE